MPRPELQPQRIPLIQTLLELNKIPELVNIMQRKKLCKVYLNEYGMIKDDEEQENYEKQIANYVHKFSISQAILIKAPRKGKVNYFDNIFLQDFTLRKLHQGSKLTPKQRKIIWLQLTDIRKLSKLYSSLEELELNPSTLYTIAKDIERTHLTTNFSLDIKTLRQSVKEVLQRFAKYNPTVSYCQGMNMLVAYFIEEDFTNEECFFLLKRITQSLLPCDYYSSMESVTTYCRILFEMLALTHPKVHHKMKNIIKAVDGSFIMVLSFAFTWFVCLFCTGIPGWLRCSVMDYFLLEGVPALLKASLACFDHLQPFILSVDSFQEYIKGIDKNIRKFSDLEMLTRRMNGTFISKRLLEIIKEHLRPKMKIKGSNEKIKCHKNWCSCAQTIRNLEESGKPCEFYVARTNEKLLIIDDYLLKARTKFFFAVNNNKSTKEVDYQLVIRMPHSCLSSSEISEATTEDTECSPPQRKKEQSQKMGPREEEALRRKIIWDFNKAQPRGMKRSESQQFMLQMLQNESMSNLCILQTINKDELMKIKEEEEFSCSTPHSSRQSSQSGFNSKRFIDSDDSD